MGAVRLARNHVGVDPIKYQGGWKSLVFLKYTAFDQEMTEEAIKNKFSFFSPPFFLIFERKVGDS